MLFIHVVYERLEMFFRWKRKISPTYLLYTIALKLYGQLSNHSFIFFQMQISIQTYDQY